MEYRIVIDQSTSGTKALLVNTAETVQILSRLDLPHRQLYPQKGWVEHDPIEIISNVKELIEKTLLKNNLRSDQIKSLSITNQRESVVIWDKRTGELHTNVMVWQCNRGLEICNRLQEAGYNHLVNQKTGLTIDPYFSASKLKWFFDSHQLNELQLKDLAIGTIDTWLVWNLTEGSSYLSDVSNACRTLLFNIFEQSWDTDLLNLFNVPQNVLPEVVDSVYDFGSYLDIPIVSIVADSQAALYGHQCNTPGKAKATLGTGCSVLMNIGPEVKQVNEKILTTIAWRESGVTTYALEGVIRSFGDILNWEQDTLQLFDDVQTASEEALALKDNGGVYFVPALEGLGAPFWEPGREAAFEGISRNTTKKHLIRASFEAMLFQIRAVIDAFEESCGVTLAELHVDGGASKNPLLMQLLSDITQKTIISGEVEEISAVGTLAIIGETMQNAAINHKFEPVGEFEAEYQKWLGIVERRTTVTVEV
ncbi:FGGY family carbohydrate kinase [Enterococcus sp. HY326]|uniref:FGGY family carbohydrate kinase n=1 Tax=Enterococcus sp. HY326 TaxID=2971265 RepID=UPI0022402B63|nr:FGGY family carbohydrate kinase [Enterococcus sp. HY326]